MPRQSFAVEVHGLDVLRQKLDQHRLFGPIREEMIAKAARAGSDKAQEASKGRYGKKGFRGRVKTHIEQDGLVARVDIEPSNIRGIALTIEEGRRPGRRPPYRKLKEWAQAAGISTPVRQLQEDIKLHGTTGIHFMEQASKVADDTLRDRRPATEREIEAAWNR